MRARTRAVFAVTAALALLAALLAAALAYRVASDTRVELARSSVRATTPRLARAIDASTGEITLVWFGTRADELPAGWRALPGEVQAFFSALERRYPGRVRTRVFEPAHDAEAADFATRIGLAPTSARSVLADGWTDTALWSSLRITAGPSGAALVAALTPDLAPTLPDLVAAQLESLRTPRRARVAFAAPDEFLALRTALGARADVFESDFARSAQLAADTDLLVWLEPRDVRPEHVRALEAHLASGGCAWIAGSRHTARVESSARGLTLALGPANGALDALAPHFGLTPLPGSVLDRRGGASTARANAAELAMRVASIGEHQDFRTLRGEPGATLFFVSPTGLEPDSARLAELGYGFRALACSSPQSVLFTADATTPGADTDVTARSGATALLALLTPSDAWRGSLLVAGSASPFSDRELADDSTGHRALVNVLANELASSERALRHALARERAQPLEELAPRTRVLARVFVVLAPALLALAAAAWFARTRRSTRVSAKRTRAVVLACLALPLAAGLAALLPGSCALDATRTREHALPDALVTRARDAARTGRVEIVCAFSPDDELPPELVAPARRARERVAELARAERALGVSNVRASAASDRRALTTTAGDAPVLRVTSELDETTQVRFVHASVLVACGERRERIDCADARAFEAFDFRLAFALERARGGANPLVAFAAGAERLSPSEALLEYERRGRFAPRPGTRFAAARFALAGSGFTLRDVDPDRPELDAAPDALVWLAPRREVEPLGRELARALAQCGRAFVALQHYRPRPERRSESAGALVWWPEPQFPDLDTHWLPALGIATPRELVTDTRQARAPFALKRQRAGERSALELVELGSELVVRATLAMDLDAGDVVFPGPARFVWNDAELATRGLAARPLVRASNGASSRAWKGGAIAAGELARLAGTPCANAALAVRLDGRFPGPSAEPTWAADPRPLAPCDRAGALVLCGSSDAFTDDVLSVAPANERFLVREVAELVLAPDLAALAGRGGPPRGLDPVPDAERARWRLVVLGAAPLLLVVGAALFAARRRVARARFASEDAT